MIRLNLFEVNYFQILSDETTSKSEFSSTSASKFFEMHKGIVKFLQPKNVYHLYPNEAGQIFELLWLNQFDNYESDF